MSSTSYKVRYRSPLVVECAISRGIEMPPPALHSVHSSMDAARAAVAEFTRSVQASGMERSDKHLLLKSIAIA